MMSLNTLEFLGAQAVTAVRRNPFVAVAAVTNVAVTLSILGVFFLMALNLHQMADREAKSAVITCELSGEASAADAEAALLSDLRIKQTRYVTKDQNLREMAERYGRDYHALKLLPNPLPDTIIVRVNDPEDIEEVCKDARKIKGVSRATYPEQVTKKLLVVARAVDIAGAVAGAILVLAALTVISTTIRLTIYARRHEIRIMQLVGATRWFIRLPFVLEGVFYGVAGGVIAAIVVLLTYTWLERYISENLEFLTIAFDTTFLAIFGIGLVLCGALFGAGGSLNGIRSYLRLV